MSERPAEVFAEVDRLTRTGDFARALRLLRRDPRARERPAESRARVARVRALLRTEKALAPARLWRRSRPAPAAPGPLLIVDATTRCNQDCVYCFERGARDSRPDMTYDELDARLVRAKSEGFARVNFIGGEITLVPWLARAVRRIRALGMSPGLVTNGTLLSSRRAVEELAAAGLDWIELSFLSVDPDEDARTCGLPKGLELRLRALENVRAARARGRPALCFNLVLTTLNAGSLAATVRFLAGQAPDLILLKGVFLTDGLADASVVPRWSDVRAPLAAALRFLDRARVPFLVEDVPLCAVPPKYRLNQPDAERTGGVGFAYGGGPAPDFAAFRGRDGALLAQCADCALVEECRGPQSRYVELFGASEFRRAG